MKTKYGLEISALTANLRKLQSEGYTAANTQAYQRILDSNAMFIQRVAAFVNANGGTSATGDYGVSVGIISDDAKDPQAACGLTFFGTEALAQKLAAKFPDYKVIAAHDGKVIAATGIAVPKPRPAPGP